MQSQNTPGANTPRGGAGSPGMAGGVGSNVPLKPEDQSHRGSDGQGVVGQATQVAGQVVERTQETTGQVVDQVRQQASARLSGQISNGSHALLQASQAMTMVGEQLRQQEQPMLAEYADQIADRVQQASSYLRDRDLDQLVDDAERFARRQPAIFLGGAFALGLLAARFLKSSRPQPTTGSYGGYGYGYGSPDYGYRPSPGYGTYGTTAGTYGPSNYTPPSTGYGAGTGYGTTATGYGTTGAGSTGMTGGTTGTSYGTGTGSGTTGTGRMGTTPSASTPYPHGATGGTEPETGYTPTV